MDCSPAIGQRVLSWRLGLRRCWRIRLMLGYRSFPRSSIGQSSLQLLNAKLKSCDIAKRKRGKPGAKYVATIVYVIPPFLAPRELIVCCRTFILAASLLTSSARWQLAITLYRISIGTGLRHVLSKTTFTLAARPWGMSATRFQSSRFWVACRDAYIESKLTPGVIPAAMGCPRSLIESSYLFGKI